MKKNFVTRIYYHSWRCDRKAVALCPYQNTYRMTNKSWTRLIFLTLRLMQSYGAINSDSSCLIVLHLAIQLIFTYKVAIGTSNVFHIVMKMNDVSKDIIGFLFWHIWEVVGVLWSVVFHSWTHWHVYCQYYFMQFICFVLVMIVVFLCVYFVYLDDKMSEISCFSTVRQCLNASLNSSCLILTVTKCTLYCV